MSPISGLDPTALELGPANVSFDSVFLGFLGDDLAINMTTEAVPLTGAQTGTVPQDKVVTGGTFQVVVPFKEISLANINKAFPNSDIFVLGGTKVEFRPKVGLGLRSIAKELKVIKVIGSDESTDPADIFVIPIAAAVDAEVSLPFSPTEQRVFSATFEAWPDPALDNRWAFTGDEFAS